MSAENIIHFNRPYMTGKELFYISKAHFGHTLSGDGPYTKLCHKWLENKLRCHKALLTHSCTAAIEMTALLLDISPGDEVIMPSYTFVSTANPFVLRGGVPVFVDIREDTLNLDEKLIEDAITPRTRAIVPVHYAGVGCEMDAIMEIAARHNLLVVEDAAQGFMAEYKGKMLGNIGHLGALSFHETKNIISGEGGALLVNDPKLIERSEILREKGTDRSRFFRGQVDKYTWQDVGSSYLPGEIISAFLWAQLEEADAINANRAQCWERYHSLLRDAEEKGYLRRPIIPSNCKHNAHMYYVLLPPDVDRQGVLSQLAEAGVHSVFHYVPLHSAPAGIRFGRTHGSMANTDSLSARLIRLPLWVGLSEEQQIKVVTKLTSAIQQNARKA